MIQNRISGLLYNGYVRLVLTVNEVEIDKVNNTSTVEWELWLERNTTYVYNLNGTSLASVYFNDNDVIMEKYVTYDLRDNSWVSFGKGRKVIQHDKDGNKAFTIWARLTDVAGLGDIGWINGTARMTKIDRGSQIKTVTATELGQPVSVVIDRKIETFKHTVWYRVNTSEWFEVGTNVAYAKDFVPPITLAEKVTTSDTGTIDICVRTFTHEGVQIGEDTYSYGNKIRVPASLVPTFERLEVDETNNDVALILKANNFLQDKSRIRATIVGASSVYGATIVGYKIKIMSQSISNQTATVQAKDAGEYNVEAEVIDSRGRKHVKTQPIKVHAYSTPRINAFFPIRSGNRTNRNVKAQTSINVPAVEIDGRNVNEYRITVRYAVRTNATNLYSTVITTTDTVVPFNKVLDLGNIYNLEQSYDVELAVTDKFNSTATSESIVGTANVLAVLSRLGFSIGAVPEENEKNMFMVALPSKFKNTVNFNNKLYYNGLVMQTYQLTTENGKSLKYNGNLNELKTAGSYHAFGVQNNPNGTNNYGYVNVTTHSTNNGYCVQFYVPFNSDQLYIRRCDNDKWHDWIRVVTTGIDTEWKNASLYNGWKNHPEYHVVQFSKSVDGIVYLKGTATGGDTTKETSILILPEGYRPKTQLYTFAMNDSFEIASLSISTDGRVVVKKNVDSRWLNFDNISFKV